MHLLHRVAKLDTEPTKDISLPCIVLRVDSGLHLFIVDHANPKGFLRFRRVEGGSRFLDLRKELLPVGERVTKPVEHVFGFEVP